MARGSFLVAYFLQPPATSHQSPIYPLFAMKRFRNFPPFTIHYSLFAIRYLLLTIAYCLSPIPCLSAFELGTPAGETGEFATQQKHFYGDYISAAPSVENNVWGSSSTMVFTLLPDGTTSHLSVLNIIPGNTYYYWFESQGIDEQKAPAFRMLYVSSSSPGYVIFDGAPFSTNTLISQVTVWHNWAGPPPAPLNLTSFWSADNTFISLEWVTPQFSGQSILDLVYGGGYEIERSSVSFSENMFFISSITAITSNINYKDYNIVTDTTYYYRVRAYDAYRPPLYSTFATTIPETRRTYLTVDFILDVSNLKDVKSISIVGDFTTPTWYPGRLSLSNRGDGTWGLSWSDVSMYTGAEIKYKYLLNDEIYEDDMPLFLGGPNRVAVLKDEGLRRMTIKDNWSVWTPTITPSNLPDFIVGFSAEPRDNVVRISWDYDPFSTGTIAGYLLRRSTSPGGYALVIASTNVLGPSTYYFIDTNVLNYNTYYYELAAMRLDGNLTVWSYPIKAIPPTEGASVPIYNVVLDTRFSVGDTFGIFGDRTGEVNFKWDTTSDDPQYGKANKYVVRYSTFPVTDAAKFRKARVAGVVRGQAEGHHRLTTLSLGENCPGYYFVVCAVYGSWHVVSLSTSTIVVAPKQFNSSTLSEIRKTTRKTGNVVYSPAVASVSVPRGAFPRGEYLGVIRNYYELSIDAGYSKKISDANKLSRSDERFGYLLENEAPESSSIFAFDVYDVSRNNYFVDADKSAKKDITVSISYDGLNIPPEELKVGVLNEKNNFWRILKDIKPEIDHTNKVVRFKTRNLSVYGLFKAPSPASDLSNVKVYPNPFKPTDGLAETGDYFTGIKFINLTRNAKIRIYNIAGELVRDKDMNANEFGDCRWNAKNDDGEYIASGVYVFVVKDDTITAGQKKFIGKVGIVR